MASNRPIARRRGSTHGWLKSPGGALQEGVTSHRAHPAVFFVLYLPFGAAGGYFGGALEYFYSQAGVSTAALGLVLTISLAPQVAKVLWAPLVDTTLTVKAWYLVGVAGIVAGVVGAGALPVGPNSLPALTALALAVSVASTFCGMSAESLMAHATARERRGVAGGWSQAGNVGGAGLGGGAGLWLATHLHSIPVSGAVIGAACGACALALLLAPRSTVFARGACYAATLLAVGRECLTMCRSRQGFLTLLVFVLPLGAGGAAQLFSAIAKEWNVTADLLAAVNWLVGLATAAAAIVGGYISDRIDRKAAYVAFGVIGGLVAAATALAPRTPDWFVAFVFAYSAALGLSYAAFSAATLEAIGVGAAATKYNLMAGVSNIPVWLMPAADGWADSRWGVGGLLWLELAVALAGAAIYTAVALASRRKLAPAPA